jgi:hypothetical protein
LLLDSARGVFADELYAYGNSHFPPLMWTQTSSALRLCILIGLAVLLFNRRWPRPLRLAAATLALVVGGVQLAALVKFLGLDFGLVDRLPRLHYLEFYTPPFYAVCGGFALCYWRELLFPRLDGRGRALAWAAGAALFVPIALFSLPGAAVVIASYGFLAVVARFRSEPAQAGWIGVPLWRRFVARGALLATVAVAIGAWLPPSAEIYPIFYRNARCQTGVFWCRDAMGPTVGMGDNPIARYLRDTLRGDGRFAGRAETLIRPPVRFERLPAGPIQWTPALYERLHAWYARAYDAQAIKYSPIDNPAWLPPQEMTWDARGPVLVALDKLGRNDVRFYGPSQENLVLEMHRWYLEHGAKLGLVASGLLDPWGGKSSIEAVVDERDTAFFTTGNGLVQRALPFQGVAVASSYEQSLGYLYYLLWTRYVSAGRPALKSINLTSLEALHPERLALLGVRYVVARDSAVYEALPLERVMGWHGYAVYALPEPNLAGYAVGALAYGATLTDELRELRRHGFRPRETAVVPAGGRAGLGLAAGEALGGLARSSLTLATDELLFSATSAAGRSFVVLPVNWSHCWRPEWRAGSGRLVRADVDLIGVAFAGTIELRLRWTAGYGAARACLVEDRGLVDEARRAAAEVGFATAYEPIDAQGLPFASARPRFAEDPVEERVLERTAMYQSGEEVVVPAAVKARLSADEVSGKRWTRAVEAKLERRGEGYGLLARNGGGASLEVLSLVYSACWSASWQGRAGMLVPVDGAWPGVLFRDSASLELRLPAVDAGSSCAEADRARQRIAALLAAESGEIGGAHYRRGDTIAFRAGGGSEAFTARGWWEAEPWGRWTVGREAQLVLRLTAPPAGDLVLEATLGALLAPKRPVVRARVSVNGAALGAWEFRTETTPGRRELRVPRAAVGEGSVLIVDFTLEDPVSPAALGISGDTRQLGLSFTSLAVRPAGGQ